MLLPSVSCKGGSRGVQWECLKTSFGLAIAFLWGFWPESRELLCYYSERHPLSGNLAFDPDPVHWKKPVAKVTWLKIILECLPLVRFESGQFKPVRLMSADTEVTVVLHCVNMFCDHRRENCIITLYSKNI